MQPSSGALSTAGGRQVQPAEHMQQRGRQEKWLFKQKNKQLTDSWSRNSTKVRFLDHFQFDRVKTYW